MPRFALAEANRSIRAKHDLRSGFALPFAMETPLTDDTSLRSGPRRHREPPS
jgi:hypothetical protein